MLSTLLFRAARVCTVAVAALGIASTARAADDLTNAIWQGDMDRSLELVRTRIDTDPTDFEAHRIYIDLLASMGFSRAAAQQYRERISADAPTADDWALVGRAEPKPQAALTAFELALSIQPDHSAALTGKAGVLRATGKHISAIETYQAALAADPTDAEAWTGLVQSWLAQGAGQTAVDTANKAIAAAPDDPSVWLLAATLSPDQSLKTLTKAAKLHPEVPQVWAALARARFESGDWKQAGVAYDKALALNPPDIATLRVERSLVTEVRNGSLDLTGAAVLLDIREIANRDIHLALSALDTLATEQPKSGQVRLVYGNLLRAIGNFGAAETHLKAARDLMPDDADAWSALGSFYLDRRRPGEARPLLEQAARTRPDDPVLAVAAAMAAAESGDTTAAEKGLRDAVARYSGSVGPILGLTRLLISTQRGDEALDLLTDSIRKQAHVELALALISAGKELGRLDDAVTRLEKLANETGDPRLKAAAAGLRHESPQGKTGG